jgi:hypothetical protein
VLILPPCRVAQQRHECNDQRRPAQQKTSVQVSPFRSAHLRSISASDMIATLPSSGSPYGRRFITTGIQDSARGVIYGDSRPALKTVERLLDSGRHALITGRMRMAPSGAHEAPSTFTTSRPAMIAVMPFALS